VVCRIKSTSALLQSPVDQLTAKETVRASSSSAQLLAAGSRCQTRSNGCGAPCTPRHPAPGRAAGAARGRGTGRKTTLRARRGVGVRMKPRVQRVQEQVQEEREQVQEERVV